MATFPKLIYRFNETSIRIPAGLFAETEKLMHEVNMHMGTQGTQNRQNSPYREKHSLKA